LPTPASRPKPLPASASSWWICNAAPRGQKVFIFYNPPVVNRQLGIRRSSVNESRRVALEFIERDLKTLVFANSRLASDLLVTYLKDEFRPSLAESVTRLSRRHLPRGGKSSGASATAKPPPGLSPTRRSWALISARSMASSWWVIRGPSPRAGSAPDAPGGDRALSAAVILASSAALDQYIIEHPHYFFGRFSKHAFTNSQNLEILIAHLTCAAFVLPIRDDERFGPHPISEVCRLFLEEQGFLHQFRRSLALDLRYVSRRRPHSPRRFQRCGLRGCGHYRQTQGYRRGGFSKRADHAARTGYLSPRGRR